MMHPFHPDMVQLAMKVGFAGMAINYFWPFLVMCLRYVLEFKLLDGWL